MSRANAIITVETSRAADSVLSPDGSRLYVALAGGNIDVFDVATGKNTGTYQVGSPLAAMTIASDGSFLLVNDAEQAVTYRVSTSSGAVTGSYTGQGNTFTDVQIIDDHRAVLTGVDPSILDLNTGTFSDLPDSVYYSGYSVLTSDGHLTLLGETGISSGPLFVLDNETGKIVASGTSYDTPNSAYNDGVQAISAAAGKVLQFAYSGTINVYDLNLKYQSSVKVGEPLVGMTFDASGQHVYAYLENGMVVTYEADSFNEVARTLSDTSRTISSKQNFGSAISVTGDGRYAILVDYKDSFEFNGESHGGVVQIVDLLNAQHVIAGTSSSDILVGTSLDEIFVGGYGTDTLTGGGGNDTFRGDYSGLTGDIITDFSAGDAIVVTDDPITNVYYARIGSTLKVMYSQWQNFTPFIQVEIGTSNLRLVLAPDGDGTELMAANHWSGLTDFGGDGHSDILWHNVDGSLSTWTVTGNLYGDQVQQSAYNSRADVSWKVVDTFDFNGDARSDILWRQDGGAVAVWTAAGDGFASSAYYHADPVPTSWRIAGTGDLNGDGKDDLMWQHEDGSLSSWQSDGFRFQEANYTRDSVGANWKVEGLGDFNGDARADILWRNTDGSVSFWTNQGDGKGFDEGSFYQPGLSTAWHIAAVADLNGDGKDDIVWRNDNGAVSTWHANGSSFDQSIYNAQVDASWHIVQTGDFNADGKADLLWQNDNGAVSTWQSDGSGFQQSVYNSSVSGEWSVAAHDYLI